MSSSRIAPSPPASSTVYMSSAEDKTDTHTYKPEIYWKLFRCIMNTQKQAKDFLLQARRVLFLPCQSDRMRHTQDTFYIYWKTATSWCFLCSAERAAASIFRAKRHKAHNDFGRNESTQRRKTHGEMKMVSNWLHFFGVAKPRHGSTLWLSHTAGLVTIVDKDGGTFQTRGFSLLTPHVLHSITPPLLSFCPCGVPSFTFPPPLFLFLHHLSSPWSPPHPPRDQAWQKDELCCAWKEYLPGWLSQKRLILHLCHRGHKRSTAAMFPTCTILCGVTEYVCLLIDVHLKCIEKNLRIKSLHLKISCLIVPEQSGFYFQDSYLSKCAKMCWIKPLEALHARLEHKTLYQFSTKQTEFEGWN